jgi:hypothetical protein
MTTELSYMTDEELMTHTAMKQDATPLEIELMQRLEIALDALEELEGYVAGNIEPDPDTSGVKGKG